MGLDLGDAGVLPGLTTLQRAQRGPPPAWPTRPYARCARPCRRAKQPGGCHECSLACAAPPLLPLPYLWPFLFDRGVAGRIAPSVTRHCGAAAPLPPALSSCIHTCSLAACSLAISVPALTPESPTPCCRAGAPATAAPAATGRVAASAAAPAATTKSRATIVTAPGACVTHHSARTLDWFRLF